MMHWTRLTAVTLAALTLLCARAAADPAPETAALPRLLDLGATQCLACKKLAPILEELEKEYAGSLTVEFIDVWKKPAAGKKHGIARIPTQIFFAPDGKELFRHVGFISKADILAKWKELGYDLTPRPAAAAEEDKDEAP